MKLSLYSLALESQKQRLLNFNNLLSNSVYLLGLAAQGIGGGHPAKELSLGHQQSSFSTQCNRRLYDSVDILNKASDYGYQYA